MRTAPLVPFSKPRRGRDGNLDAEQVRGALNQLQNALAPVTTPGVSTALVTIHSAPEGQAVANVVGSDGTNAFADQVAWHPTGAVAVMSSHTTKGAPSVRTYAISAGALQLSMSTGTYAVQVIPTLFA